jgi:hypothetical protein
MDKKAFAALPQDLQNSLIRDYGNSGLTALKQLPATASAPYTQAGASQLKGQYLDPTMRENLQGVTYRDKQGNSFIALNPADTDQARTHAHEMEHVLANQGLGHGSQINKLWSQTVDDPSYSSRGNIVKRLVDHNIDKALFQQPQGIGELAQDEEAIEIEIIDPEAVNIEIGDLELSIVPAEDDEFNENLADVLEEDTIMAMAGDLAGDIEQDKSSRKDWEKAYTEGLKLLGLQYPNLGRQVSIFIPAEDIILPYGTTDLDTCYRLTHVMRKTKNEIIKLQQAGFYRDIELPDPSKERDNIKQAKDKETGFSDLK